MSEENHLREELLFWRCEHHIVAAERDRLRTRIDAADTVMQMYHTRIGELEARLEQAEQKIDSWKQLASMNHQEKIQAERERDEARKALDSAGASVVPAYFLDAETGEVLRSTTDRGDRT